MVVNTCVSRFRILWVLAVGAFLIALFGCDQKNQQEQSAEKNTIAWLYDIDRGIALAKEQNKPLMVDFTAEWCPPCKRMNASTFSHPDVIQKAGAFVPVRIDVDQQGEVADSYNANASRYGGIGIPNVLFMDHEKMKLKHIVGYRDPEGFVAVMDSVLVMLKGVSRWVAEGYPVV
jgi:thiol:disulfide interchange protein